MRQAHQSGCVPRPPPWGIARPAGKIGHSQVESATASLRVEVPRYRSGGDPRLLEWVPTWERLTLALGSSARPDAFRPPASDAGPVGLNACASPIHPAQRMRLRGGRP